VREVIVKREARKYIKRLSGSQKQRIVSGIAGLAEVPPRGDIYALAGQKGELRLRVGDYRVRFKIEGDTVYVTRVSPRGQAYKVRR
jgi:mRNA interferase RelE/StbE